MRTASSLKGAIIRALRAAGRAASPGRGAIGDGAAPRPVPQPTQPRQPSRRHFVDDVEQVGMVQLADVGLVALGTLAI
jgi:hypothetical protein